MSLGDFVGSFLDSKSKPTPSFLFGVEIRGIVDGFFTECSGLSVSREVIEYKASGLNQHNIKVAGRLQQENISLKRGVFSRNSDFWSLFYEGLSDHFFNDIPNNYRIQRANISIIQYGFNMPKPFDISIVPDTNFLGLNNIPPAVPTIVRVWNLHDAFPVKWQLDSLDKSADNISVETIELAYHYMTADSPMDLFGKTPFGGLADAAMNIGSDLMG